MKKTISLFLIFAMLSAVLISCGSNGTINNKLSVVTTIFPEYDWVLNILGDAANADVTMLLDNGVDLHSYQPTADDIIKIANCDLFIYVGGESDEWVDNVIKENKNATILNLLDILGSSVKEEEIKEGMIAEDESESEEVEYDEHVWLSLKNSVIIVNSICDALSELDPQNAEMYKTNAADYIDKLNSLDKRFQSTIENSTVKTVLFGDRFPFRYLVDDYGLDYYAAFVGCSAESEASFETIKFLADKVDELGLTTVLTLEGTNQKIAETIISTSKSRSAQILSMDSMQSTTLNDVNSGATYISIMEKNLDILSQALQ